MSKKCADCGCEVNRNVIQGMYYCPRCDDDKHEIDVLPMTIFDRITASPEVLAENIVVPIIVEYSGDVLWVSPLLQKDASKRATFFDSKEESIAATVAKLKEVEK